jgi:tetratricopeptide (TPR) repeat protein
LAATVALAILSMRSEFSPVLSSSNRVAVAEQFIQAGRAELAFRELTLAAADDPWSPAPQRLLAYAALNVWVATRLPDDWDRFVAAADAYQRLNPRHHATYTDRGHWLLLAWRTSGDSRHLDGAIDAYQRAILWYPRRGLERAQLSWALHLAGRETEAQAAAKEAQRLDELTPHRELKLFQQMVYDPKAGTVGSSQSGLNAEQVVRQLRIGSSLEKQP